LVAEAGSFLATFASLRVHSRLSIWSLFVSIRGCFASIRVHSRLSIGHSSCPFAVASGLFASIRGYLSVTLRVHSRLLCIYFASIRGYLSVTLRVHSRLLRVYSCPFAVIYLVSLRVHSRLLCIYFASVRGYLSVSSCPFAVALHLFRVRSRLSIGHSSCPFAVASGLFASVRGYLSVTLRVHSRLLRVYSRPFAVIYLVTLRVHSRLLCIYFASVRGSTEGAVAVHLEKVAADGRANDRRAAHQPSPDHCYRCPDFDPGDADGSWAPSCSPPDWRPEL
jgi:hypothetical protein